MCLRLARHTLLLLFSYLIKGLVYCGAHDVEDNQHLKLGMKLLVAGDYSDALTHFHAAIDANPDEYMSYYKRATVYMALSRSKQALADLDRVIQLKPDFLKAKHQRGELLLKMGMLNEAYEDLECIVKKEATKYQLITTVLYVQLQTFSTCDVITVCLTPP